MVCRWLQVCLAAPGGKPGDIGVIGGVGVPGLVGVRGGLGMEEVRNQMSQSEHNISIYAEINLESLTQRAVL